MFFLIQLLIFFVFSEAILGEQSGVTAEELVGNGDLVAVSTCATGVVGTLLILLLARARRGIGVRDYLGLQVPPWQSVLAWLGIAIVVVVVGEVMIMLAGRETVPEFAIDIYRTSTNLPLLWIALIVAAPLFEEFLFRGFLFSGWLQTRLSAMGTILLTSALWTLIHAQYDADQLLIVFVYGIVLGLARYRTGSLITPLVIHGAINLAASVQVSQLV